MYACHARVALIDKRRPQNTGSQRMGPRPPGRRAASTGSAHVYRARIKEPEKRGARGRGHSTPMATK